MKAQFSLIEYLTFTEFFVVQTLVSVETAANNLYSLNRQRKWWQFTGCKVDVFEESNGGCSFEIRLYHAERSGDVNHILCSGNLEADAESRKTRVSGKVSLTKSACILAAFVMLMGIVLMIRQVLNWENTPHSFGFIAAVIWNIVATGCIWSLLISSKKKLIDQIIEAVLDERKRKPL